MTRIVQPDCPEKTIAKVTEVVQVTATAFVEMTFPSQPGEIRRDIHLVGSSNFRINFWKKKQAGDRVIEDAFISRSLYVIMHKDDKGMWSHIVHNN